MTRTIEIEIGGHAHKVRYDFNAIADIEQRAGMGISKLMGEDNTGFNSIRMLVWGGMKFCKPKMTFADAGNLLQQYMEDGGNLADISQKLVIGLQVAGLVPKDVEPVEPEGNDQPGE